MKSTILTAAFIVLAIVNSAFAAPAKSYFASRTTTMAKPLGQFNRMIVTENIHVILVPDDGQTELKITGDENLVPYITVKQKNNALIISSRKNTKDKNITVLVPVKNLRFLDIRAGASVVSGGIIDCPNLNVLLGSDSRVELTNRGDVEVLPAGDCEINYEKRTTSTVVTTSF